MKQGRVTCSQTWNKLKCFYFGSEQESECELLFFNKNTVQDYKKLEKFLFINEI